MPKTQRQRNARAATMRCNALLLRSHLNTALPRSTRQVQSALFPVAPFRPPRLQVNRQPQLHTSRTRRLHIIAGGGAGGGLGKKSEGKGVEITTWQQASILGVVLVWVALILVIPFVNVFFQAFSGGVGPFLENLMDPDFQHAVKLTLMLAAFAVPINTIFGVVAALAFARTEFKGKQVIVALLDIPFSVSPVVAGLMLTLLYGRKGFFEPVLRTFGLRVVFAFPGMLLATLFVTLPFVVRELLPVLESMDLAEEEAAKTLGANDWEVFWNVTLPNMRWGLLYGMILTNARAMGEFGAVAVISGNIIGRTQTLTQFVESSYKEYNTSAAYSAAVLLSAIALVTLFVKDWLERASASEQG